MDVTITLPIEDLRSVLALAEIWAFRMRRTKPELGVNFQRIAESVESQVGKRLTVASLLAAPSKKET